MNSTETAVGHQHDHVTRPVFIHDSANDPVDIGNVAGALPLTLKISDKILRREPLGFRQGRSEHTGNDHLVGATKSRRKVILKYAPAG